MAVDEAATSGRDRQSSVGERRRRSVAFVRANFDRILLDIALLSAWSVAILVAFQNVAFPRWLFYAVLFLGAVGYARATRPWSRPPARSDGDDDPR